MTTRDAVADGAPIWIDLATTDVAASRAFYGGLLGWGSEEPDPELGGYLNFLLDGQRVAGCMPAMPGAPADVWTTYLATDDVEKTCERVLEAGGTVHAAAMAVRDLGRMAVVGSPGGPAVGLWQPGTHAGLLTLGEPGHAAWFEVHTTDHSATRAFYTAVFGWELEDLADSEEFRYAIASVDGEQVAGLQGGAVETGDPHWTVALQVEDTDDAVRRAVGLGATLTGGPDDTPYGRLAWLRDTTGAPLTLAS